MGDVFQRSEWQARILDCLAVSTNCVKAPTKKGWITQSWCSLFFPSLSKGWLGDDILPRNSQTQMFLCSFVCVSLWKFVKKRTILCLVMFSNSYIQNNSRLSYQAKWKKPWGCHHQFHSKSHHWKPFWPWSSCYGVFIKNSGANPMEVLYLRRLWNGGESPFYIPVLLIILIYS